MKTRGSEYPTIVILAVAVLVGVGHGCSNRRGVAVGGRCKLDESCATGVCLRETRSATGVSWSEGYCSGNCNEVECPEGGRCASLAGDLRYCLSRCAGPADCREGYVCARAIAACVPDCRRGWDCGPSLSCSDSTGECTVVATGALGAPCRWDAECLSALCIPEQRQDAGVAWPGGACSQVCPDGRCPGDSVCVSLDDGSSYCLRVCGGDVGCRDGYACSSSACLPDCRLGWDCGATLSCNRSTGACDGVATKPVGAPCTLNAECLSGLCIPAKHDDAGVAWTGGACSLACSASTGCPGDAACVAFEDGSFYCAAHCLVNADCRDGYVCVLSESACLPDCRLGWSCGTKLLCNEESGACVDPVARDAGSPGPDAAVASDAQTPVRSSDAGGRGPGPGPGPGGIWTLLR